MNYRYLILLQFVMEIVGLTSACAESRFYSPSPYTRFADSPLSALPFSHFYLEDFEDGALNVPGASGGNNWVAGGPGPETDSVEGKSLYSNHGQTALIITFDPAALGGRYPTHAGIVWTDVGYVYAGSYGYGTVVFAAWDALGQSIGSISASVGDGANRGQTAEDRFFGLVHSEGISRFSISMTNSVDWEVDHLQYGSAVPITIEQAPPWITDTRPDNVPGHDRKQYFKGQKIRFPFKVRNDGTTNVDAKVYLVPAQKTANSTHGGPWVVAPQTVTLNASRETPVSFDVPVPANAEFGFYDVKAIVELASDPSIVLDTTEGWDDPAGSPNDTDRDAEGAWIGDVPATLPDATWWSQKSFQICQGNPVLLVHGGAGDIGAFGHMRALLTQVYNFAVKNFDYSEMTNGRDKTWTIEGIAGALAGKVQAGSQNIPWVKEYYNLSAPGLPDFKVDVVAHSMGGVVARAYMAGIAQDTTNAEVAYGNEIDKIVTLGSPLCGRLPYTDLGYYIEPLLPILPILPDWPTVQLRQLALGSRFMWNLHTRARQAGQMPYERHFSIGSDAVVGSDLVVGDWSSFGQPLCNRQLARTVGSPYTHIALDGFRAIAGPTLDNWASHEPFLLTRDYLEDGALWLTLGRPSAHDGYSANPCMIKIIDARGQPVNGLHIQTAGSAEPGVVFQQVDRESGIYAALVPTTSYLLTVSPASWWFRDNMTISPIQITHVHSGSLETVPLTLQSASGANTNGWPAHLVSIYPAVIANGAAWDYLDSDDDGFNDWTEIWLGTNPEDASNRFAPRSFAYTPAVAPPGPGTLPPGAEPGPPYRELSA